MFLGALFIHIILIFAMCVSVVFFETDCKKIIFWSLIIILTGIVGFAVYFVWFCDKPALKKSIRKKFTEDEVYKELVEFSLTETKSSNETLNFNKRHYCAEIFKNSDIKVINSVEIFDNTILHDLENASQYIIIDTLKFLAGVNNENVIQLLKEKQSMGVTVNCVYTKRKFSDRKTIKELRLSGVNVCKFNKRDTFNKYYKNAKNVISIDGNKAYIYNICAVKSKDKPVSLSNLYYALTGDVVRTIDLDCHLDVNFATQKYYNLEKSTYDSSGDTEMQYVSSVADKDFEGSFLKAINDAKKQIIIHINQFIPTPSIKQALVMAILSGIDVKIMLSKAGCYNNYYASRAYIKEMAMYGATAYIYDGVIGSNFVIIDNLAIVGNFSIANLEIRNNLQNMLIVNNANFSKQMLEYFHEMVKNSYRICKPKNVLLKEKIFKKFN